MIFVIYLALGFLSAFLGITFMSAIEESFGDDTEDFLIVGVLLVLFWPVCIAFGALWGASIGANKLGRRIGRRWQ